MKIFFIAQFSLFLLLAAGMEARTLVFTYQSPEEMVPSYNIVGRIEFWVQRLGDEPSSRVSVTRPLQFSAPITMTDEGFDLLKPYTVRVEVLPKNPNFLPHPSFENEPPDAGRCQVVIDGVNDYVLIHTGPFPGDTTGFGILLGK